MNSDGEEECVSVRELALGASADSRSKLKVGKNLGFLKYNFTYTKFVLYSKIHQAPMILSNLVLKKQVYL